MGRIECLEHTSIEKDEFDRQCQALDGDVLVHQHAETSFGIPRNAVHDEHK